MGYSKNTIKDMLAQIRNNELYLPAIQRKFVWEEEQICSLFDSIMRSYPIGTFLFWRVDGKDEINKYTFYKFLQHYHERDHCVNEVAPRPEIRDSIVGVLDGQQRLSSMYIALQGTYASKRRYARKHGNDAYPKKRLHLNLLGNHDDEESGLLYDFRFLTEEDALQTSDRHLWFRVSDVLKWDDNPDIDARYDELIDARKDKQDICKVLGAKKQNVKFMLRTLHEKITREEIIHYYRLKEQELDDILDIFIRVNSGGTVLSKTDLLFSTIVANWEEARQEIDGFIDEINDIGDGFEFDNDFIMRSCLVLTDGPVLFKVGSFKKENVQIIRDEWEDMKDALRKTVETIADFGFNGETLTSNNAIVPIAYYFLKGGKDDDQSLNELRRYLVHALLKGVYGGQSDQVIASIRETLRVEKDGGYELKERAFSFETLLGSKLPGRKTLQISGEDIQDILESEKGAYTFMALSLLYPQLKFGQVKFHQDHIHPATLFTDAKMKKCGIDDASTRKQWQRLKDKLPNLQLMEGRENESKNKTPFKEWFLNSSDVPDRVKYVQDNHLPSPDSVDYDIINFSAFYEARKEILRQKLKGVLKSNTGVLDEEDVVEGNDDSAVQSFCADGSPQTMSGTPAVGEDEDDEGNWDDAYWLKQSSTTLDNAIAFKELVNNVLEGARLHYAKYYICLKSSSHQGNNFWFTHREEGRSRMEMWVNDKYVRDVKTLLAEGGIEVDYKRKTFRFTLDKNMIVAKAKLFQQLADYCKERNR